MQKQEQTIKAEEANQATSRPAAPTAGKEAERTLRMDARSSVSAPRSDLFGRIIGFLVFLGGICIIVFVLMLAFEMFRDPNVGLPPPAASSEKTSAVDIGVGFGKLLVRILLLFLGSIGGSLIANRGIQLYFSALQGRNIDRL